MVEVKSIEEIKSPSEITEYDGYIIGSPTFSFGVPELVRSFLDMIENTDLERKTAGAFGPYVHDIAYKHDNYAPAGILDILQKKCKMEPFELGPFLLQQELVETAEGIKSCQDYGRVFGEKLNN